MYICIKKKKQIKTKHYFVIRVKQIPLFPPMLNFKIKIKLSLVKAKCLKVKAFEESVIIKNNTLHNIQHNNSKGKLR